VTDSLTTEEEEEVAYAILDCSLLSTVTDSLTTEEEEEVAYAILDFHIQIGTKDRPFIIMADSNYPERNGAFDITRIEKVEHNNYERNGHHVRLLVDLPNYTSWDAFTPNPRDHPSLLPLFGWIVVMFKGPPRPYRLRDFTRDHNKKKISCSVTESAYEKTDTAIEAAVSRQNSSYLVMFKPRTVLDNSIFSSDNSPMWRGSKMV
jgi:hypothetical protein